MLPDMSATSRRALGLLLFIGSFGGSLGADCFPASSAIDGGYVGPGAPSVEVTVDGVHVGPAPATTSAFADLTANRDANGRVTATDLTIHAVAANASCDFHFDRFGTSVLPFAAGATPLQAPLGDSTTDGTTAVVGALTVTAGNLTLQCFGSDCNASVLAISVMDAAHIEGYVSGTLADPSDRQASSTVCTFYVPWRTYSP